MESSNNLEIVLHSANNLFDVKFFGTMDPYAMIWITRGGVIMSKIYKTDVAKKAGSCPVWDYPILFKIDPMIKNYTLFCEIQHDGTLIDRKIGEVQVPFTELLAGDGPRSRVSYPVKTCSGEVKGEVIISCKFSEPVVKCGANTSKGEPSKSRRKKKDGTGTEVATEASLLVGVAGTVVGAEFHASGNEGDVDDGLADDVDDGVEDEDRCRCI
ncbi:hypothetical protein R6Q59_035489 [Mikania micrantha]